MLSSPDLRFTSDGGRAGLVTQHGRSWGAIAAIALVGAGALIFDAMTPQTAEVGIFYVGIILISFWFPHPKVAFALGLLATFLIILGYWITIPDNTPTRVVLLNRILDIGTVWVAAVFVYHTHILQQKLKAQVDIAEALSFEKIIVSEIICNSSLRFWTCRRGGVPTIKYVKRLKLQARG